MLSRADSLACLRRCSEEYRDHRVHTSETVDDFDDFGKLGQGFALVDELEEINLGDEDVK
jgi:hypothetical protein